MVASGSLRFADAVRLVRRAAATCRRRCRRGGRHGGPADVPEGPLRGVLEEAAQGEVVSAANPNAPDQVVIAGHAGR